MGSPIARVLANIFMGFIGILIIGILKLNSL